MIHMGQYPAGFDGLQETARFTGCLLFLSLYPSVVERQLRDVEVTLEEAGQPSSDVTIDEFSRTAGKHEGLVQTDLVLKRAVDHDVPTGLAKSSSVPSTATSPAAWIRVRCGGRSLRRWRPAPSQSEFCVSGNCVRCGRMQSD